MKLKAMSRLIAAIGAGAVMFAASAVGARAGEKVLYISLSETRDEVEEVAASHGWSLEGVEIVELSAIEQQLAANSQNTLFHASEIELTETTKLLLDAVEQIKPTKVLLMPDGQVDFFSDDWLELVSLA